MKLSICLLVLAQNLRSEKDFSSEGNFNVPTEDRESKETQDTQESEEEIRHRKTKEIISSGAGRGYYNKQEMQFLLKHPNPSNFCRHQIDPINIWKDQAKTIENKIGEGGFGKVFKGIYTRPSSKSDGGKKYEVAAKYVVYTKKTMLAVLREINFMRRMKISRHHLPFYQCYYETAKDRMGNPRKTPEDTIIIMMSLMPNGDVEDLITKLNKRREFFSKHRPEDFLINMTKGIRDMHWMKIVHRDIKPANFMINNRFQPILGDLGLAEFIGREGIKGVSGTPYYLAPEVVKKQFYGTPVDIYSLGVTFYAVIAGLSPTKFVSFDLGKQSGNPRSKVYYHLLKSDKYRPLIKAMTDQDPAKRPKAEEVISELEMLKKGKYGQYKDKTFENPPEGLFPRSLEEHPKLNAFNDMVVVSPVRIII